MDSMKQYLDAIASNTKFSDALQEKTLTPAELKKREEIAKAIERENPDMPIGKKMAIATAKAKEVAEDMHYCAKHIYSEEFGEGIVIEGSHAEPDEAGLIEWYDVDFNGNVQRIMTEKVKVMHAEYHMNHKKKMKEGMMDKLKSGAKKVANAVAPDDETLVKKLAKDTGAKGTYHTITKHDIRNPNGPGKQVKVFVPTKEGVDQEEAEQIDELKQETLRSYAGEVGKTQGKSTDKIKQRVAGLYRAGQRLAGHQQAKLEKPTDTATHQLKKYKAEEAELDEADKGAWKKETPWVKTDKPQKDEFGNPVKNIPKFLAKRAARKTAGDKPVKEENVKEAMISYRDFSSKIDMHRKAGSKIVDAKYDDKKAAYTVIDKEGVAKKITHTPTGMKQDHLGNVNDIDGDASKQTDKRGRGRPAGTKSGARH